MPIKIFSDRIEFSNYSLRINPNGLAVTPISSSNTLANFTSYDVGSTFSPMAGTVSGYIAGGEGTTSPAFYADIQKFPFASENISLTSSFQSLTFRTARAGKHSSETNGYASGGERNPPSSVAGYSNIIDKFPFSSDSNATDVGDLTAIKNSVAGGHSSSVSGYNSGGRPSGEAAPLWLNIIDKFPFSSDTNATDVGDLTVVKIGGGGGHSSTTHGYTVGGNPGIPITIYSIDKFSFATDSNAAVSGYVRDSSGGTTQSSPTHGYLTLSPSSTIFVNSIQKFSFSTDSNSEYVGELAEVSSGAAGLQSSSFGYLVSGYYNLSAPAPASYTLQTIIQRFPFANDSTSRLVGNIAPNARSLATGHQD